MKRLKRTILVAAAVLCAAMAATATAGGQVDTLTIIHVNDSHANLTPYGAAEYGGIARAASVIGTWKMTEPNPILIHAGDLQVGSLMFNAYFGVPELQMLNALGFDALCLGNHDFDTGPVQLAGILALAQLDSSFNILCTNAVNLDSVPALKAFVRSYAVEQRGGVKIGILGLMTPAANVESSPSPVVLSDQIEQILGQSILELKTQGCQVVILVSHLGLVFDMQIAAGLSGVDAIISGHSHDALADPVTVNNIPIVQAGEFYRYVGKLRLAVDAAGSRVLDYTLQEITSAIPAEPTMDATVNQLKAGLAAQLFIPVIGDPFQVISVAPRLLNFRPLTANTPDTHVDTLDTPMGNLVTSAMLAYVKGADCAIEATGHIVENLYPGSVTTADLFRTYPYGYDASDGLGFRMVSFDLPGVFLYGIVQELLKMVVPQTGSFDYLLQSTGLDLNAESKGQPGDLTVKGLFIQGNPVHPDSMYSFASSSQIVGYLQNLFKIQPLNLTVYPVSVFKVVKDYVAGMDTIWTWRTGHNQLYVNPGTGVKGKKPEGARSFRLEQNYPNPFNCETVIRFVTAGAEPVTLDVINARGEKIAVLLDNRVLDPGTHTVRLNAENLASGVYVYRLRTASFTKVRKMMLLR